MGKRSKSYRRNSYRRTGSHYGEPLDIKRRTALGRDIQRGRASDQSGAIHADSPYARPRTDQARYEECVEEG